MTVSRNGKMARMSEAWQARAAWGQCCEIGWGVGEGPDHGGLCRYGKELGIYSIRMRRERDENLFYENGNGKSLEGFEQQVYKDH